MFIYDILPVGRENAIPGKQLAELTGHSSTRTLQTSIQKEREAGALILSCGDGYFRSDDPTEIKQFVRTLQNRAANTYAAASGAERALDELTGQLTLNDMEG